MPNGRSPDKWGSGRFLQHRNDGTDRKSPSPAPVTQKASQTPDLLPDIIVHEDPDLIMFLVELLHPFSGRPDA